MLAKLLKLGHIRRYILAMFDFMCYILSNTSVYVLLNMSGCLYNYSIPNFLINSVILFVCIYAFRVLFGVYNYVWRYPSTFAYFRVMVSDCVGGCIALLIAILIKTYVVIWHFTDTVFLSVIIALFSRFCYRLLYKYHSSSSNSEDKPHINVAISGAGQIGALLANDLICNKKQIYVPKFFIDTDAAKIGKKVSGLPVYNDDESLQSLINDNSISEIIIAIKNINNEQADYLFRHYSNTGCKVKLYDAPIHETDSTTKNSQRVIREFQIEDLLFREPLKLNDSKAFRFYAGQTVLVTGGGGSIGSELCRQLAKCNPKKLIIFDIYENNAYDIQQELSRHYGDILDLAVEIGSVRDRERLEGIFRKYKPDVVFHAAAHKHVPLMEVSACEAVKNNVLGTYNTADIAEKHGVKKFILISTDKAVNPTNIMGATKRLCEMIVQCRNDSKTSFACVRFGNVLGSNGSVIPLFKKQIANGGPITITDKRIIRYFMTIPEASQLVIQAGAMAHRGELFVLDMGKPVKIYDLAVNMIRLSGFEPEEDIKIEEVGLRPGEKLYEELLIKSETLDKTENNLVFIEKDTPLKREEVNAIIANLKEVLKDYKNENLIENIKKSVREAVPTYHNPEEINCDAENSDEMKILMT